MAKFDLETSREMLALGRKLEKAGRQLKAISARTQLREGSLKKLREIEDLLDEEAGVTLESILGKVDPDAFG